jgi:hypothetical protein
VPDFQPNTKINSLETLMNQHEKKYLVRYEDSDINYITQFLVSPGEEEILLELSPGLLPGDGDQPLLPIKNRIALPWSTAQRLAQVLNQVVANQQSSPKQTAQLPTNASASYVPHATIPPMSPSGP